MIILMLLPALASATLASAPVPTNQPDWIRPDDMPAYHQRAGISRSIYLRLTIRPDARLQTCDVENSDGDWNLAATTCALIMERAKFEPARGADGAAAYGVYRTRMTWAVGKDRSRTLSPGDMELQVAQLPPGERAPLRVHLMYAVDPAGVVSSCAAEAAVGRKVEDPKLVAVACKQLESSYRALPVKDEAGRGGASLQTGTVVFNVGG
jgi:hypothetical protein